MMAAYTTRTKTMKTNKQRQQQTAALGVPFTLTPGHERYNDEDFTDAEIIQAAVNDLADNAHEHGLSINHFLASIRNAYPGAITLNNINTRSEDAVVTHQSTATLKFAQERDKQQHEALIQQMKDQGYHHAFVNGLDDVYVFVPKAKTDFAWACERLVPRGWIAKDLGDWECDHLSFYHPNGSSTHLRSSKEDEGDFSFVEVSGFAEGRGGEITDGPTPIGRALGVVWDWFARGIKESSPTTEQPIPDRLLAKWRDVMGVEGAFGTFMEWVDATFPGAVWRVLESEKVEGSTVELMGDAGYDHYDNPASSLTPIFIPRKTKGVFITTK